MDNNSKMENLIEEMKKTIKLHIEGQIAGDETRSEYKHLYSEYLKLKKRFISNQSKGYIKGVLYHHNSANVTNLSAVFSTNGESVKLLAFSGDKILLNALPENIMKFHDKLSDYKTMKVSLSHNMKKNYFCILRRAKIRSKTIIISSVTSSPRFNADIFNYTGDFIINLYKKRSDELMPVTLNYINEISTAIWDLLEEKGGQKLTADHFILEKIESSFSHIGIHRIIDISSYIIETLHNSYPEDVQIYAISPSNIIVIYPEALTEQLSFNPSKIDFDFKGYNIPYKLLHTTIDTPESVYQFLEGL